MSGVPEDYVGISRGLCNFLPHSDVTDQLLLAGGGQATGGSAGNTDDGRHLELELHIHHKSGRPFVSVSSHDR